MEGTRASCWSVFCHGKITAPIKSREDLNGFAFCRRILVSLLFLFRKELRLFSNDCLHTWKEEFNFRMYIIQAQEVTINGLIILNLFPHWLPSVYHAYAHHTSRTNYNIFITNLSTCSSPGTCCYPCQDHKRTNHLCMIIIKIMERKYNKYQKLAFELKTYVSRQQ
jgi:hypothetical protein